MDGAGGDADAAAGDASTLVETLIRDARGQSDVGALERLVAYVEKTSAEIAALGPETIARERMPSARLELQAVRRDVADAAERIMDSAEALLTQDLDDPVSYRAMVQAHATRILEACIFNDLAGQRLSKAMGVLSMVETRLIGLGGRLGVADLVAPETSDERRSRELILHGPTLSLSAVRQDDIDRLFDAV